jgi:hypothetical protein
LLNSFSPNLTLSNVLKHQCYLVCYTSCSITSTEMHNIIVLSVFVTSNVIWDIIMTVFVRLLHTWCVFLLIILYLVITFYTPNGIRTTKIHRGKSTSQIQVRDRFTFILKGMNYSHCLRLYLTKCRTAIQSLFLYSNLYLRARLDSLSVSFLTNSFILIFHSFPVVDWFCLFI